MHLKKPNFWDKKDITFWSIFLFPISLAIQSLFFIKKVTTKKNYFSKKTIICIGNIYLGGTGKTPLAIEISLILKNLNLKSAIIKKFYNDQFDEVELIKNKIKNVIVRSSRYVAIQIAIKKKFNILILDDGLQDNSIYKDLNIVCFNNNQLIGNSLTIPSGPLREPLRSIKNCKIALINVNNIKEKNRKFEKKIKSLSKSTQIFYSSYLPSKSTIKKFSKKKILAFAGIGNPENFFNLLTRFGLNIKRKLIFPDHYIYKKEELDEIIIDSKLNNYTILTTEKDFYRIKKFKFKEIKYIKVNLKILQKNKFIKELQKYIK